MNDIEVSRSGALAKRGLELLQESSARGPKIRVLVVEDIQSLREKYVKYINADPEMFVVGEAGNGIDGIELYQRLDPDVVSMPITMADMDGIHATETTCSLGEGARVVIASAQGEADYLVRAMLAGPRIT